MTVQAIRDQHGRVVGFHGSRQEMERAEEPALVQALADAVWDSDDALWEFESGATIYAPAVEAELDKRIAARNRADR